MEIKAAQISSLEKVRQGENGPFREIHKRTVLPGERVSYQIHLCADCRADAAVHVETALQEYVQLFLVKDAFLDLPCREEDMDGENYLSLEPGQMPDILVPLQEQNQKMTVSKQGGTLWVRVDIPKDAVPGTYEICVRFTPELGQCWPEIREVMTLSVIPAVLPQQELIYTRWLYVDCIATQHEVEIYSEKHWELIEKYIAAAADIGINMILVPVHTPPLDTEIGSARPCVQLVEIEKIGNCFKFSFHKFRRFIDICKKHGIRYFEIAHMFSQWGAKCAPNIMVTEHGKTDYLFGWHTAADSEEYISFLKQYIAAISQELEAEGISETTYFHISDEPNIETMQTYQTASDLIRPLIGNSKTMDALSTYTFYEKGLVECPVTGIAHMHEFLEHDIPNQWVYYCCGPEKVYPNCFLAMPSGRIRILGLLLYKYKVKGFLQWGFNFYNAALSRYPINPYLTTSADRAFPSGDAFIVYPSRNGVYPSIRGEITYEAIQDMEVCTALEAHIGHQAVVEMIDEKAGFDVRFDHYPSSGAYLEELRGEMEERIRQFVSLEN